jgi:hypothetical protein
VCVYFYYIFALERRPKAKSHLIIILALDAPRSGRWKQERLSLLMVSASANKFDIMYVRARCMLYLANSNGSAMTMDYYYCTALPSESSLWCRRRKFLQTPCRKLPLSNCASIADCMDTLYLSLILLSAGNRKSLKTWLSDWDLNLAEWIQIFACKTMIIKLHWDFPIPRGKFRPTEWEWNGSALLAYLYELWNTT